MSGLMIKIAILYYTPAAIVTFASYHVKVQITNHDVDHACGKVSLIASLVNFSPFFQSSFTETHISLYECNSTLFMNLLLLFPVAPTWSIIRELFVLLQFLNLTQSVGLL
jgi:hypothetical protein